MSVDRGVYLVCLDEFCLRICMFFRGVKVLTQTEGKHRRLSPLTHVSLPLVSTSNYLCLSTRLSLNEARPAAVAKRVFQ